MVTAMAREGGGPLEPTLSERLEIPPPSFELKVSPGRLSHRISSRR
jgi:hypothetical protein